MDGIGEPSNLKVHPEEDGAGKDGTEAPDHQEGQDGSGQSLLGIPAGRSGIYDDLVSVNSDSGDGQSGDEGTGHRDHSRQLA